MAFCYRKMESGQMIEWQDLNKKRFFLLAPSLFAGVRVLIYPFNLIKTRLFMQQQKSIYNGTIDAFYKILKNEGIRGLYKGYFFSLLTLISGQVYIVTYELLRSNLVGYRTEMKGLLAGAGATLVAQSITVPIDVITQYRMMSGQSQQWHNQPVKLPSSFDIFRRIFKESGPKGFFRGYSISIMTYAPNSALWWSAYSGIFKKTADHGLIQMFPLPLVQATSGMLAGTIASVLTNPLDLIRTRHQVFDQLMIISGTEKKHYHVQKQKRNSTIHITMSCNCLQLHAIQLQLRYCFCFAVDVYILYQLEQNNSYKKTVTTFWKEEGFRGLYKGLSARLTASIPVSALLVISYEWVKRVSLKHRDVSFT